MTRKLVLVVIAVLAFAFVGGVGFILSIPNLDNCTVGPGGGNWELEVSPYEVRTAENGSFYFRGVVYVSGTTGQPRLQDVRVVFLDDANEVIERVPVGDFGVNAQHERNVTRWLPVTPNRIRLQAGSIEAHEDTEWAVLGLVRTQDGTYREYVIEDGPEVPDICE